MYYSPSKNSIKRALKEIIKAVSKTVRNHSLERNFENSQKTVMELVALYPELH